MPASPRIDDDQSVAPPRIHSERGQMWEIYKVFAAISHLGRNIGLCPLLPPALNWIF